MMDRKSLPASSEDTKKRESLTMSEITPRQALTATEIRVISLKMVEIVGSKSNGLARSQLNKTAAET